MSEITVPKPKIHKPGVYFGMPAEEYHADESLSSTGIRYLEVSPEHFWENSPMNPYFERTATDPMKLGTAYHTAILEGLEAYDGIYAVKPAQEDYPNLLSSQAELKGHCKDLELPVSGTNLELCERIRSEDFTTPLWPEIKARFEREIEDGALQISKEFDRKVRQAVADVNSHEKIAPLFELGGPEVSIFVRDPETGCPLKCRPDYLGPMASGDLKTFSNTRGAKVDRAITLQIAERGYHVQGVSYWNVIQIAKDLPAKAFHGAPDGFVEVFRESPSHRYAFVFVGTDTPHVRARELVRREPGSIAGAEERWLWAAGQLIFNRSVETYLEYMQRFGTNRWMATEPIRPLSDLEFPAYVMEA